MNATEGTGTDEPVGEVAGLAAMTADVDTGVGDVRAEGDCGESGSDKGRSSSRRLIELMFGTGVGPSVGHFDLDGLCDITPS